MVSIKKPFDCEIPVIEATKTIIIAGITIRIPNLKVILLAMVQANIELTKSAVFNTPMYSSGRCNSERIEGQAAPKMLFGSPIATNEIKIADMSILPLGLEFVINDSHFQYTINQLCGKAIQSKYIRASEKK
jgi:uncharacterized membrane protein YccF (DUF307 family)